MDAPVHWSSLLAEVSLRPLQYPHRQCTGFARQDDANVRVNEEILSLVSYLMIELEGHRRIAPLPMALQDQCTFVELMFHFVQQHLPFTVELFNVSLDLLDLSYGLSASAAHRSLLNQSILVLLPQAFEFSRRGN